MRLPGSLQGRDGAVAGAGQRARLCQRPGEQGVELGSAADARARRARPGSCPRRASPSRPGSSLPLNGSPSFSAPAGIRAGAAPTGVTSRRRTRWQARRNSMKIIKMSLCTDKHSHTHHIKLCSVRGSYSPSLSSAPGTVERLPDRLSIGGVHTVTACKARIAVDDSRYARAAAARMSVSLRSNMTACCPSQSHPSGRQARFGATNSAPYAKRTRLADLARGRAIARLGARFRKFQSCPNPAPTRS